MNSTTQKALAFVLPVVIVLAIVVTVKRTKARRDPGIEFDYTVYAVDEADHPYVFQFSGPGLLWPVQYRGRSLLPLYACSDCGEVFAGQARGVTAVCPACRGHNVGMYDPDMHEQIDAEPIRADDLELPRKADPDAEDDT